MAAGLRAHGCAAARGAGFVTLCAWLILALGAVVAHAQSSLQVANGFQREVSRFRWTSVAAVSMRVARWQVAIDNRFLSDAFLRFDDRLHFRDENLVTIDAERPLGRRAAVGLNGRTAWFGLSRVFSQDVYGGIRVRPDDTILIEPVLGVAWDRRPGAGAPRLDVGPAVGGRWHLAERDIGGYRIELGGESTWQFIRPRRGHSIALGGSAGRQFGSARLRTSLRMSSRRRDTYRAASFLNRTAGTGLPPEAVEATTSDTLDVHMQLEAPLFRGLRLLGQADVGVNSRRIRTHHSPEATLFFETDFSRRALHADLGLVYEKPELMARVSVEAGAAAEVRRLANRDVLPPLEAAQKTALLAQADYDEGAFGLSAALRASLLQRLTGSAVATSRIVRHDTPGINQDDRDEVYHNGELGLQLALSRTLRMDLKVFGSYYHAVYLKAERSAESSIQRTLRLRPSFGWRPSADTDMRFASEVRATYTVDDFQLPGPSADRSVGPASYGSRLSWTSVLLVTYASWQRPVMRTCIWGRLLWNSFAEIPFDTLRTYRAWVHVQSARNVIADVGWRLFLRSDYDRAATVSYTREDGRVATISRPGRRLIEQSGPTTTIVWAMGRSHLKVDGWINMQRIRYRIFGALPESNAHQIRQAARRGSRRLIPNVMLSVLWNL